MARVVWGTEVPRELGNTLILDCSITDLCDVGVMIDDGLTMKIAVVFRDTRAIYIDK